MKEWVLDNISLSEDEYDKIMQFEKYPKDIDLDKVSKLRKKQILLNIVTFTLNKPGIVNRLGHKIKKLNEEYYYNGYTFKLFYDYLQDEDLFSFKRYGVCHEKSARLLYNNKGFKLVTAICKDFRDAPYLHSFLIGKLNSSEIVLDYTQNLVISKEAYFDLFDVEVVSIMDYDTIHKFIDEYNCGQYEYLDLVELLCFPKQVNEAILKLERTKKQ